jgi:hypothetical protein
MRRSAAPIAVPCAILVALLAACGSDSSGNAGAPRDVGPSRDAAAGDVGEGSADAATDAATDAGADTGPDVAADTRDGSGAGDANADTAADAAPPIEITETVVVGPADLPARFEAAVPDTSTGPAVVYPVDRTAMPRNVWAPLFQWEGPSGGSYRLRIVGGGVAMDVFTTEWSWQPSPGQWESITRGATGHTLTLQVAEVRGGTLIEGPSSTLAISSANVDGAVYYWAPTQSAIVRLPVDAEAPEPFVPGTAFSCAGCHALSPDGSRLAYTRGGGTPIGPMGVIATDASRRQIQPEQLDGYYPSFAPDNVNMAVARGGSIVLINTDTGDDTDTLGRPDGTSATQPTWSPRGDTIVFAAGASSGGFDAFAALGVNNGGLAMVRRGGGRWGSAEWLLEPGVISGPGDNYFYPAYSPDGSWVAFNRATSSAGAGSSPPGSELWLVNANPAVETPPLLLANANGPIGTTNSWPKWAPITTDDRMWLAFTSTRPYGRVATGGSQIWIASVRANDAFLGVDPSSAAYWMPHQELSTSNHVAYWAPYRKDDEAD